MNRYVWLLCAVALAAGCGDDDDAAAIDAAPRVDGAITDATALTCSTGEPPNETISDAGMYHGPFLRCGVRGTCNPPVCWFCVDLPTGPRWSLVGDELCVFPDAGVRDAAK